jgi:hypothetical protein
MDFVAVRERHRRGGSPVVVERGIPNESEVVEPL